jgi:hypothetical protein
VDLVFLDDAVWLNPPPAWGRDADLWVEPAAESDFWRETQYGFVHDSGHALTAPAPATFTAEVTFAADYRADFDQAGLMLWQSPDHWIKAGVELSDGVLNLSAVVTRGRSDWSTIPAPGLAGPVTLRLSRTAGAAILHVRMGDHWRLMRLADFPDGPCRFGIMACAPSAAGFRARFSRVVLGQLIAHPLHSP